jgi:hypothetical protein
VIPSSEKHGVADRVPRSRNASKTTVRLFTL